MDQDPWQAMIRELVARAILAPSSHNTQPWRFRVSPAAIELRADRRHALPVNDPEGRELVLSCGCALMNLRIAAAGRGLATQVDPLPEPGDPELLARVTIVAGGVPAAGEESLARFIDGRRTWRKRFAAEAVDGRAVDAMVDAAAREGARLLPLVGEDIRLGVAALVSEGNARLWRTPDWRRELAAWMRPRGTGDGLGLPGLVAPLARWTVRSFDLAALVDAQDRRLLRASPLLAVLATEGDRTPDWLRAGQALQRVLLTGCAHGLQASHLNQPIQVAALRRRLAALAGTQAPQVLLRLGKAGGALPGSPRRAPEAAIEWQLPRRAASTGAG